MSVYVDVDVLKATLTLSGTTFADEDLETAARAASDAIDNACGTTFEPSESAETRYFTAGRWDTYINLGDFISLTSIEVDRDGDGVFETAWTVDTDYLLEPFNAVLDGKPYSRVSLNPKSSRSFPSYPRAIKAVGIFGWAEPPSGIVEYAGILATQLVMRKRQAPFGFVINGEAAARISRTDPQFELLVGPYVRTPLLV